MKSSFSHLRKLICGIFLFACAMVVTSCLDIEPSYPNTDNCLGNFDGLWVEQVKSGSTVVPHIDIKGNSVILCKSNPFEHDYSNRVEGTLQYSDAARKGIINFTDGSKLEFICDEMGNFCSKDTVAYYKIDNTLDKLQELKIESNFTLSKDYVGPEHDLGIDLSFPTLLGDANLTAGGAWYVDLLKFAGESFAKGAISWAGGKGLEVLVSCFYTDPTSKKLESILTQIDGLNKKLAEIEDLIKMEDYELYINKRTYDYCSPLTNYSKKYADAMVTAAEKKDTTEMKRIVEEWHNTETTIGGSLGGPMEAAANYMDYLMKVIVNQNDIYSIYDIYTYNCSPWEHQGYDFRQGLRASDLSLIHSNAMMAMFYAEIHDWAKDPIYCNYVTELNDKYQEFIKFCEKHPVEVRDQLVCQIPNAHFVMEKKFIVRDYNIPPMTWYSVGSRFYHGESTTSDLVYYGGTNMSIEEFRQRQIKPAEMKAILDHWGGNLSAATIFTNAGVPMLCRSLLILCGDTTVDWDDNLFVNLVRSIQDGESGYPRFTDWLQAKCHWSMSFSYWFDGWNLGEGRYWVTADATNVLYRY